MKNWNEDKKLIAKLSAYAPVLNWADPTPEDFHLALQYVIHANLKGFGLRLRQIRVDRKENLRDAGAACGLTYAALGLWENGRTYPSKPDALDKLLPLARHYGLNSVADLLPDQRTDLPLFRSENFQSAGRLEDAVPFGKISESSFIPDPAFAFEISDKSMCQPDGKSLYPGSVLLCSGAPIQFQIQPGQTLSFADQVKNAVGRILIANIDFNPACARELIALPEGFFLHSWNRDFPDLPLDPEKKPIRLFGVALRQIATL